MDNEGEEMKYFDARDGHGIRLLARAGIEVGLLTGRSSRVVTHRARDLGIRMVYQNVFNKPYSCINFADKVKKSPVFQHLRIATGSWLDLTGGEFQRQSQRADYVLQLRRQTVRRRDPSPQ